MCGVLPCSLPGHTVSVWHIWSRQWEILPVFGLCWFQKKANRLQLTSRFQPTILDYCLPMIVVNSEHHRKHCHRPCRIPSINWMWPNDMASATQPIRDLGQKSHVMTPRLVASPHLRGIGITYSSFWKQIQWSNSLTVIKYKNFKPIKETRDFPFWTGWV